MNKLEWLDKKMIEWISNIGGVNFSMSAKSYPIDFLAEEFESRDAEISRLKAELDTAYDIINGKKELNASRVFIALKLRNEKLLTHATALAANLLCESGNYCYLVDGCDCKSCKTYAAWKEFRKNV